MTTYQKVYQIKNYLTQHSLIHPVAEGGASRHFPAWAAAAEVEHEAHQHPVAQDSVLRPEPGVLHLARGGTGWLADLPSAVPGRDGGAPAGPPHEGDRDSSEVQIVVGTFAHKSRLELTHDTEQATNRLLK